MPVTVLRDALNTDHATIAPGVKLAQVLGNNVEETPLHCGSYIMEPGSESTVDYPCSIFCLQLEGEFSTEDLEKPGIIQTMKKGDICHIGKGAKVKWTSKTGGKGFYVIQLPREVDAKPYFNQ